MSEFTYPLFKQIRDSVGEIFPIEPHNRDSLDFLWKEFSEQLIPVEIYLEDKEFTTLINKSVSRAKRRVDNSLILDSAGEPIIEYISVPDDDVKNHWWNLWVTQGTDHQCEVHDSSWKFTRKLHYHAYAITFSSMEELTRLLKRVYRVEFRIEEYSNFYTEDGQPVKQMVVI